MNDSSGPDRRTGNLAVLAFLALFAAAMGYLESAVVVYLRGLYYPEGFSFPLAEIGKGMLVVELGRELATVVMLLSVAWLSGKSFWERFAFFMLAFGLWDIFYYVWLWVLLAWPESLLTWDILFLIPVPWIAPVLSPVVVSLSLITGSVLILLCLRRGGTFAPNWREWTLALGGALLVLLSYTADLDAALGSAMPRPYRWDLLIVGEMVGFYALFRSLARAGKKGGCCG